MANVNNDDRNDFVEEDDDNNERGVWVCRVTKKNYGEGKKKSVMLLLNKVHLNVINVNLKTNHVGSRP